MNSDVVKPEKYAHLHLVYHYTVPLKQKFGLNLFSQIKSMC